MRRKKFVSMLLVATMAATLFAGCGNDSGKKGSSGGAKEFDAFFAEAVMAWLLADGEISDEEAQYLIDKINEDDDIDDAEDELLESIAEWGSEEGHNVPVILIEAFPDYFEEDEE